MKIDGRLKHEAMQNKGLLCHVSTTQYAYNKIAHFRMNGLNINLPPVRMHCSHARPCCCESCCVLLHNPKLQFFVQWQEA